MKEQQQQQQQKGAGMDPRFAKMYSDPRFQRFPKKKAKVEIDSRFAGGLGALGCGLHGFSALLLLPLRLCCCWCVGCLASATGCCWPRSMVSSLRWWLN